MNLDHDFFQVSKLSEDQKMKHFFSPNSGENQNKKSLHQKWTLFSPNSGKDLRSDARQSQIIGGMLMKTILKLLGGYIPPSLPGFGTPVAT